MPSQGNRISYGCASAWTDSKGRKFKTYGSAYVNAIKGRNGRRMYVKTKTPYGELVIWLPSYILKEMVKFLEQEKKLGGMSSDERAKLYGRSLKDQGISKENAHLAPTHIPSKYKKKDSEPIRTGDDRKDSPIISNARTSQTANGPTSAADDSNSPQVDVHPKPSRPTKFARRL